MARLARIVIPDLPHHVIQRGNRRQEVFFSDDDYQSYLDILLEQADSAGLSVLAYCLMPNHVHLITVPAREDSLRAAIAATHRRYARRVNDREGWRGHLWQERFHSFPMDDAHLYEAVRYVELNPVRAGLARTAGAWRWSSAPAHLTGRPDPVLMSGGAGEAQHLMAGIEDWGRYLTERDIDAGQDEIRKHVRTGRPFGDDGFVGKLEQRTGRTLRRQKPGPRPNRE